jgi:hypothetical protein
MIDWQRDHEAKRTALAWLAFKLDFTPHDLHQLAANHESQPGAAMQARNFDRPLCVMCELFLLLFRRDTHTGISHREGKRHPVLAGVRYGNFHRDRAGFCKFNGIAHQIH